MAQERHRRGVPPGRQLVLDGRGTTWIRELSGPPGAPALLLLHGWVATGALNWSAVFEPLARHYRVIAVDHRGHGRGIRASRFRLADCADDAAAVVSALGLEKAVAVGYSMGGPIAQLLWHRHPERVAGLVLCATSRDFRGRRSPGLAEALLPGFMPAVALGSRLVPPLIRRRMLRAFLTGRIRNPQALDWVISEVGEHDPGAIVQAGRAISRFSSREWIGGVDVPTAVVVTERDELVRPDAQRKLAAAIPGATIHPVDGDHAACAFRPEAFTSALLDACGSVIARTAESTRLRRMS